MAVNEYLIGVTLRVRGATREQAKQLAGDAVRGLAGETICGAWIDRDARLFDPGAFAVMPGQTSMETDS